MSSCESSWLYDCFVLYWCQSTQPGLSATSVICPLDPGHDRDSQLVASGPPATVENVLLQQGEERFHGRVIARCAYSSHRPDDAVTGQSPSEFLRSELAAAVAVGHASGHVTPPGHSHLEGIDSQPGLHPRADRIANDPRRVGVLTAQRYSACPHSYGGAPEMSVNHSWFGPSARNSCLVRPSASTTAHRSS